MIDLVIKLFTIQNICIKILDTKGQIWFHLCKVHGLVRLKKKKILVTQALNHGIETIKKPFDLNDTWKKHGLFLLHYWLTLKFADILLLLICKIAVLCGSNVQFYKGIYTSWVELRQLAPCHWPVAHLSKGIWIEVLPT